MRVNKKALIIITRRFCTLEDLCESLNVLYEGKKVSRKIQKAFVTQVQRVYTIDEVNDTYKYFEKFNQKCLAFELLSNPEIWKITKYRRV